MALKHTYTTPSLWPKLKAKAKEYRANPTKMEAILWEHLRGKKIAGAKFRRQHPIGRYIVDFCCPEAKLVVELDGGIHRDNETEDAVRQEFIERLGFKVIRFSNAQIGENLQNVVETISGHFKIQIEDS